MYVKRFEYLKEERGGGENKSTWEIETLDMKSIKGNFLMGLVKVISVLIGLHVGFICLGPEEKGKDDKVRWHYVFELLKFGEVSCLLRIDRRDFYFSE